MFMTLTLASGKVVHEATEAHLRSFIDGEDFAILGASDGTYMQCAERDEEPFDYLLEYQEETLDRHYHATDGPITLERVTAAFIKYLRGDTSWRKDFQWEKLDLSH
jgi:hypothetical protein